MGRTTIVLGIVALGLLGFILLYERDTLSTSQLEERKGRVLREFVRDRVEKLEIQRKNVTTVLRRERERAAEEGAPGYKPWQIEEPLTGPADEEAVDDIMAELEWLQSLRSIENPGKSDLERFQLDKPRLRVWFTAGNRRIGLAVGADDPHGRGVYLQVLGRAVVHVVPKHVLEAFDHDPGHYYTKTLFELLVPAMVHAVHLKAGDERVALQREKKDGWWVVDPERVRASAETVDALLRSLTSLRASRYAGASSEAGNPDFGLTPAAFVARIELDRSTRHPDADGARREETLELSLGAPCAGQEQARYLRAGPDQPVMCVDSASLEQLTLTAEDLWEKKAVTVEESDAERIELRLQGQKLVLERKDGAWHYEGRADGKAQKLPASQDAIATWIRALRNLEATAHQPLRDQALAKHGLNKPMAELRFLDDEGEELGKLQVGREDEAGVFARRNDEPSLLQFDTELLGLLDPAPERFAQQ